MCAMVGAHTKTKNKQKNKHLHLRGGAYWKPYSTGYGFLAYGPGPVKNKLDFFGQLGRLISEYVFGNTN